MTAAPDGLAPELVTAICRELWRLAKAEDDLAAAEAAATPYWRPCSPSVLGHRAAAGALRADAMRLENAARPNSLAS
ncbi:hypothetical protein D0Z08_01110 [Nocardioides immobilis]|uniref:Uncharacterized protein n=1 Tax=Nocardioides immobilis TaxID=2049295 RepID=A0A417Y7S0_9ACTN|nr:hypothetical protein [Nocardioides immobilis]RHW28504.1 hypothetical protein D0Z08_01110 [Nocardioides immobilis]